MTIYLVAQEDGKASIADTTTIFSEAVQNKMLQLQDIDVPLLNEKLECMCNTSLFRISLTPYSYTTFTGIDDRSRRSSIEITRFPTLAHPLD